MNYKEIMEIIKEKANQYNNENDFYCTEEYKSLYKKAMKLYKKEGIEEKRNNFIYNTKRLNQISREVMGM